MDSLSKTVIFSDHIIIFCCGYLVTYSLDVAINVVGRNVPQSKLVYFRLFILGLQDIIRDKPETIL